LAIQAIAGPWTVNFADEQAGFLEDPQMLRHGRLGKRQNINNFAANAFTSLGKCIKDAQSSRVRHRLELRSQALI
jgi:hypothetical protein